MFGLFKKKASIPNVFTVYDTGSDGNSVYELRVGHEIDHENAKKLANLANGSIVYSIHTYENGEKKSQFVNKNIYIKLKNILDGMG